MKIISLDSPNVPHKINVLERPATDGARITKSSAYIRWLIMTFPTLTLRSKRGVELSHHISDSEETIQMVEITIGLAVSSEIFQNRLIVALEGLDGIVCR